MYVTTCIKCVVCVLDQIRVGLEVRLGLVRVAVKIQPNQAIQ